MIKLDAAVESRVAFMENVERDIARLANVTGANGVQLATTSGGHIGTMLQKIAPIIDSFASVSAPGCQSEL